MWGPRGLPLGGIGAGWLVPVSGLHIDLDQLKQHQRRLSFFQVDILKINMYLVARFRLLVLGGVLVLGLVPLFGCGFNTFV